MSRWTELVGGCRAAPRSPGVYVVFRNGQAVYVGQSVNLRARLSAHEYGVCDRARQSPADVISIRYSLSRKRGDWLMREYRLIQRLKPLMNSNGTGVSPEPRGRVGRIRTGRPLAGVFYLTDP